MNSAVAFTFDLEDHHPNRAVDRRYAAITESLLDDLDDWGVTGTVFVVGELIAESTDLIRSIAERGHEVGLHGADHQPLPQVGPQRFRAVTAAATESLAAVTGRPVLGFRAPTFSLVPASAWAPEILAELGYVYSSSVLPVRNPLFGWPEAPAEPFRWPCGLVEIPIPVAGLGPIKLPLLGGVYLRVAPGFFIRWARRRLRHHPAPLLYAHPYDLDPDEARWAMPMVGRMGKQVMWWGRRRMRQRVGDLTAGSDLTLSAVAARHADAAVFGPDGTAP